MVYANPRNWRQDSARQPKASSARQVPAQLHKASVIIHINVCAQHSKFYATCARFSYARGEQTKSQNKCHEIRPDYMGMLDVWTPIFSTFCIPFQTHIFDVVVKCVLLFEIFNVHVNICNKGSPLFCDWLDGKVTRKRNVDAQIWDLSKVFELLIETKFRRIGIQVNFLFGTHIPNWICLSTCIPFAITPCERT